ncbi:signal recognition particle 14 kDa protein [Ischnura elegans]|uniref:signal recognition particle 14 kDa protein n=1 Tax=Ischnura elegans TaxID=197161 RepID=UPI001ED88734|nr:signal recognition particle 14 kDa protein [Ischnura elegans]
MVLLENEVFLSELTRMFQRSKTKGSVTITMKRYDGRQVPLPTKVPTEYLCLMRATLGNKKISTVVHPKDVNKFQQAYCNLLKGNLDGLKKLKKSKKKAKATQ